MQDDLDKAGLIRAFPDGPPSRIEPAPRGAEPAAILVESMLIDIRKMLARRKVPVARRSVYCRAFGTALLRLLRAGSYAVGRRTARPRIALIDANGVVTVPRRWLDRSGALPTAKRGGIDEETAAYLLMAVAGIAADAGERAGLALSARRPTVEEAVFDFAMWLEQSEFVGTEPDARYGAILCLEGNRGRFEFSRAELPYHEFAFGIVDDFLAACALE